MKNCSKCKETKELSQFWSRKESNGRLKSHCKSCLSKSAKKYEVDRIRTYDEVKSYHLRKFWPGKSSKEVLSLYKNLTIKQNNLCAICGKVETVFDNKRKEVRSLAVDHCHRTGKVRGLLCMGCNQGLGNIKENFDTALNLARYIQQDQGVI